MKKRIATIAILLSLIAEAKSGTITGIVRAHGKRALKQARQRRQVRKPAIKFLERVNYEEMHDFIVYIEGELAEKAVAPLKHAQVVTVKNPSVTQKARCSLPTFFSRRGHDCGLRTTTIFCTMFFHSRSQIV